MRGAVIAAAAALLLLACSNASRWANPPGGVPVHPAGTPEPGYRPWRTAREPDAGPDAAPDAGPDANADAAPSRAPAPAPDASASPPGDNPYLTSAPDAGAPPPPRELPR